MKFDDHWEAYKTKHTVLQAKRIRISRTNLQRIAKDAHTAGQRKDTFDVFWTATVVEYPALDGKTIEISTSGIAALARLAFHPAPSPLDKIKKGFLDIVDTLADQGLEALSKYKATRKKQG